MNIDAGDTVKHLPSGEEWIVAALSLDGAHLYACGWPETMAGLSDCELIAKASTDQRIVILTEAAKSGGARARAAQSALERGDYAN
jgi:hypothetical protein